MRKFFNKCICLGYELVVRLYWMAFIARATILLSGCDNLADSIYVQNSVSEEVLSASSVVQARIVDASTADAAQAPAETPEDPLTNPSTPSEIALTVEAKIVTLQGEAVMVENPTVSLFDADLSLRNEGIALLFDEASQIYLSDAAIWVAANSSGSIILYFNYKEDSFESSQSFGLTGEAEQRVAITVYMAESEEN
jgi:hypothetical protein